MHSLYGGVSLPRTGEERREASPEVCGGGEASLGKACWVERQGASRSGQCCYLGELLDRVLGKRARSKKGVKFLGVSGGTVRGDSGLIVNGKIVAV